MYLKVRNVVLASHKKRGKMHRHVILTDFFFPEVGYEVLYNEGIDGNSHDGSIPSYLTANWNRVMSVIKFSTQLKFGMDEVLIL